MLPINITKKILFDIHQNEIRIVLPSSESFSADSRTAWPITVSPAYLYSDYHISRR